MNKEIKQDLWKAEFAVIFIRRCHFNLSEAIEVADSILSDYGGDTEEITPDEAVSEEILAMISSMQ